MANGKGTLDCLYCTHFAGKAMGVGGNCDFHQVQLPDTGTSNKVCVHFEPTEAYRRDNGPEMPPARRFTSFREDLNSRILYVFRYNAPDQIQQRIPLSRPAGGELTAAARDAQ